MVAHVFLPHKVQVDGEGVGSQIVLEVRETKVCAANAASFSRQARSGWPALPHYRWISRWSVERVQCTDQAQIKADSGDALG